MFKKISMILLVVLITISGYIHFTYPMSPITFESIPGSNEESWYDFKKNAGIELEYWNKEETENYWISNHEDIRFVYNELIKSEIVDFEDYPENRERFVWFLIRNGLRGEIIQQVDLMENGIAETDQGTYVKITEDLHDYLIKLQEKNYIRMPLDDE
jgi:hypothetical protein